MHIRVERLLRRAAVFAAAACALFVPAQARGGEISPEVFHSPGRGEVVSPGSIVEIRWASVCEQEADREVDEAEIVLSLDGGMTFPVRISTELSPCASRFRWSVPALPTSQARLGLRTGAEERDESERIETVSAPFVILPDPEGRPESLYARGAEWWTPQAPARRTAEDSLGETIGGANARLIAPAPWTEIAAPVSSAATRPAQTSSRAAATHAASVPVNLKSLASSPAAPIPLRC